MDTENFLEGRCFLRVANWSFISLKNISMMLKAYESV